MRDRMGTADSRTKLARVGTVLLALAAVAWLALDAGGAERLAAQEEPAIVSSSLTMGSDATALSFELADGSEHSVEFRDGTVRMDGRELGSYRPGGALERAWRGLLGEGLAGGAMTLDASALVDWSPPAGLEGSSAETARALDRALESLLSPPDPGASPDTGADEAVTMTGPEGNQLSIAPGGLSFENLVSHLENLDSSLSRLGEDAAGAGDDLGLIVHDDYTLGPGSRVTGNLALLDGELRLEGRVDGDVLVLDGTLVLEPAARVGGDVLQVGGSVRREGGRVAGEFLSVQPVDVPSTDRARSEVEDARAEMEEARDRARQIRDRHRPGAFSRLVDNVGRSIGGVLGVFGTFLVLGLIGALLVYFLHPQLEVVADTARHSFGRSFGVGFMGIVLAGPLALVLTIGVITIPLLIVYVPALVLAALGGYLAVTHATGEVLAAQRFRYAWLERLRRSNSYYYVLSGLAALLAPFALAEALHLFGGWMGFLRGLIAFAAWVVTSVAVTVGFGATLLSRGGRRGEFAGPFAGRRREAADRSGRGRGGEGT